MVIKVHAVINFEMANGRYTENQRSERHSLSVQHSPYQTRLYSSHYIAELRYFQWPTNHIKFLLAIIITAKFPQTVVTESAHKYMQ